MPAPDLSALADALTGRLVLPSDPDWDEARLAWNRAIDQRPAAVAIVADADDVVAVIRFARQNGLRVAPQGTGHLAGSLGDLSGSILLRTSRLTEVVLDAAANTVRAGSGAVWGEVVDVIAPHGLAALAGSASDVGVAGYTLGGGVGWLGRKHGLAASAVTAVDIVTADGVLRHATADSDAELFWAVRGGGGSFGVVTAIEFRVFPVETVVAGMMLWPMDRAPEVLHGYASWTATLPDTVSSAVRLLRMPPIPEMPDFLRGRQFIGVDGALLDLEGADKVLAPLRALGPEIDTFAPIPPSRLHEIHMDPPQPSPSAGDGLALADLGPDEIAALLAVAGPGCELPLIAVDVRHLGGAYGRAAAGGGAVSRLDGGYAVFAVGVVPAPQLAPVVGAAVASVLAALAPWAAATTYSNFREGILEPTAFHAADVLARLRAARQTADPDRMFHAAHPV